MKNDFFVRAQPRITLLEQTQKDTLDVTHWQTWFLNCLLRAIEGAQDTLGAVLNKAQFWERFATQPLNERQIKALTYLQKRGRITNREYHDLCPDVTPETLRLDLADMVSKGLLLRIGAKRGTYYILK